jgi:hypothetical protein
MYAINVVDHMGRSDIYKHNWLHMTSYGKPKGQGSHVWV